MLLWRLLGNSCFSESGAMSCNKCWYKVIIPKISWSGPATRCMYTSLYCPCVLSWLCVGCRVLVNDFTYHIQIHELQMCVIVIYIYIYIYIYKQYRKRIPPSILNLPTIVYKCISKMDHRTGGKYLIHDTEHPKKRTHLTKAELLPQHFT